MTESKLNRGKITPEELKQLREAEKVAGSWDTAHKTQDFFEHPEKVPQLTISDVEASNKAEEIRKRQ